MVRKMKRDIIFKKKDLKRLAKLRQMEEYNLLLCYGKSFDITIKMVGIVLDVVIPMTFGLITLGLCKLFGGNTPLFTVRYER